MLPEFKKRIDTLRDILVGAVPSPAGQIEQITYALIYKFMNDKDDDSAGIGGKRIYFTGEYEKYSWHQLMTPTLGAHDRLTLYREALGSLAKSPGLPELFQGIFQNAYLTFNDPRVLTLFLKEIDNFKHSTSDDIGDAYEYLLQITGAQGDVGQFRTPRHIIKFITEAVNPTKGDSILDPAVGTAGFLIAAYNHVKHHHDGVDEITGLPTDNEERLTADELDTLHKNYHGFDIDPTMVRTAKVNMYLHGFTTPDIKNHDSLSSEDYWTERYDVILANPPFMSPKGGIKPHDKFGIKANRAEVLFVDYIASHLKPTGRAGIVVPEGIIFQGGKAYKELRKNLIDNYLYAVVSLPAGVFQPYSGVKTSVLLIDKKLARQRDEILFIKIENDGYSLGAQRRKTVGSQFPEALEVIQKFQAGEEVQSELAHTVSRQQITESGDYNLGGDRYKTAITASSEHQMIPLGEVVAIDNGNAFKSSEYTNQGARVIRITNVQKGKIVDDSPRYIDASRLPEFTKYELFVNDLLMSLTGNVGRTGEIQQDLLPALLNQRVARLRPDETKILKRYLFHILNTDVFEHAAISNSSGIAQKNLSTEWLKTYEIPLPPIEIQREIVTELDNCQKIIDAAQTIVKTYKPVITVSPEWTKVKVAEVAQLEYGIGESARDSGKYRYIRITDIDSMGCLRATDKKYIDITPEVKKYILNKGDVLVARTGATYGKTLYFEESEPSAFAGFLMRFNFNDKSVNTKYFWYFSQSSSYWEQARSLMTGGGQPQFNAKAVEQIEVPLPSLEEQEQIVNQLDSEQQLIHANRKLIETFQAKIKSKIAEVWGE